MERRIIAINALSALQGGGQSYISNLLRYASEFSNIKIYIFAPPQFAHLYALPKVEVIPSIIPSKGILHRIIWERLRLPELLKKLKIHLIFCPGGVINFSPPSNCMTAVTFQNMLIFDGLERQRYPLGYRRLRLALLERISRKSFKQADLVIFLSEYAKKVVDEKVPDRKGLSVVIPHGLDDRFRTAGRDYIPRLKSLPEGDYLLYVSVIDVFKAQIEIVRAYHILCQKQHPKEKLLLVGSEYPPYGKLVRKEIRRLGLQDKVIITGQISYTDMPSVYHHAKAHIFASSCENCPNIVLESLASGRPLFLSNRAPMPEFAGDAAIYFNPYNPEELSNILARYLDNESWIMEMGKKAFERSLLYSWEKTARETFRAFENLYKTEK